MSYQLKVVKDHPIGFWPLDESSGTTAIDISGCDNNGTYTGAISTRFMPLISGGSHATQITDTKYLTIPVDNDYYGSTADGGFADSNSSDNDFSLEIWLYPQITDTALIPLMADDNENIGIYYDNGNIVFYLESERLDYTIYNLSRVHHIVASYTPSEMVLTVNGESIKKSLSGFKFTNEELTLKIGPTNSALDYFLVDAPAVYRYALKRDQVLDHLNDSVAITQDQIAYPEEGTVFSIYDDNITTQFKFSYPADRPLEYLLNSDLFYDPDLKCVSLRKTELPETKTVVIEDAIAIPMGFDIDSSKIEWESSEGVTIRTKVGSENYESCVNGKSIPQFRLADNEFSDERILFIEITFSSTDSTKYLPRLNSLTFSFYNDQRKYSSSNADYIYTLDGLAGATNKEITFGRVPTPAIRRDAKNGLRTDSGAGFRISAEEEFSTIELFFTPSDLSSNTLISSTNTDLSWNGSGVVSKTNISAIYVNGVDKSSETDISNIFMAKDLHHVVVVLTSPTNGEIKFNYGSSGGPSSLYQYIIYYSEAFNSAKAISHYQLHIGKPSLIVDDSSFTLTEGGVEYYNNDWIVIQSV